MTPSEQEQQERRRATRDRSRQQRSRVRRPAAAARNRGRAEGSGRNVLTRVGPRLLGVMFPAAPKRGKPAVGRGAFLAIVEAAGQRLDVVASRIEAFASGPKALACPETSRERAARRLAGKMPDRIAEVFQALGSTHRLRILGCLLEGPATYRLLQRRTGLKAGPLYHHINELRLVGLIGPRARDTYVLNPPGRNAVLAAFALRSLV